jgi:hypothetical protein
MTQEEVAKLPIGAVLLVTGYVSMEYGHTQQSHNQRRAVPHTCTRPHVVYLIGYKRRYEGTRRDGNGWDEQAEFKPSRAVFTVEVRKGPSRKTLYCLPEQILGLASPLE